jgi:uncharacterized membrane-anchored protein
MHKNDELSQNKGLSKVSALTRTFLGIKILATTLGETDGDALSMSLNLGYLPSKVIYKQYPSCDFVSVLFFKLV